MGQLQHEVHVLMWANIAILGLFGFLVFCWVCEFLNKFMNKVFGITDDARRSNPRKRRIEAQEKKLATQQAFQEAVAAEVAKLTGERAT